MPTSTPAPSNFAHLQPADPQLMRLGLLAEKYLAEDPNTSLIKMRQFAELLAQTVAARMGVYQPGRGAPASTAACPWVFERI